MYVWCAAHAGPPAAPPVKTAYGEKTIFGHKNVEKKQNKNPSSLIYMRLRSRVFEYKQKNKNKNSVTSFYIVESEKGHTSLPRDG